MVGQGNITLTRRQGWTRKSRSPTNENRFLRAARQHLYWGGGQWGSPLELGWFWTLFWGCRGPSQLPPVLLKPSRRQLVDLQELRLPQEPRPAAGKAHLAFYWDRSHEEYDSRKTEFLICSICPADTTEGPQGTLRKLFNQCKEVSLMILGLRIVSWAASRRIGSNLCFQWANKHQASWTACLDDVCASADATVY